MSQNKVSDVRKYWINRSEKYTEEFTKHDYYTRKLFQRQEKTLLKILRSFEFETVFEVGIGFGRITKLMLAEFPHIKITGIDISPVQIENARKYIDNNRVNFMNGAIQDINMSENSFDLVIASEVLMHIPFTEIKTVIGKMVKISKQHILNLDWHGKQPNAEHNGYIFNHDYKSIYHELGLDKLNIIPIPRAVTWEIRFGIERGVQLGKSVSEEQIIYHAIKNR